MRNQLKRIAVTACLGWLAAAQARAEAVTCASSGPGDRQHCQADTSAGVALVRETGTGACILGRTWGYDDTGVWVTDGCGGEFVLGKGKQQETAAPVPAPPAGEGAAR